MRVPTEMTTAFGKEFEDVLKRFIFENQLVPELSSIDSPRFLARSIIPHVQKLSDLFNRVNRVTGIKEDPSSSLDPYWNQSSHPANLRLAYLLSFMPPNLYRVASVWAELARLGYRWPSDHLRAVEFGAGPATGTCGVATGERFAPIGLPQSGGTWALIEQDSALLKLGKNWANTYLPTVQQSLWHLQTFHRKIDLKLGFLPPAAPKFNLWLMSFYLNELETGPETLAQKLLQSWERHLEEEGLVILVEPALKAQSRKLLELRQHLIADIQKRNLPYQVLLPCLGHQLCGALKNPEDWCHEEVSWWRPPYFRKMDQMAGLDRKTLAFSYLVLAKTKRPREEVLPALGSSRSDSRFRLVSPAHREGRDLEFHLCGQEGKRKARFRPEFTQTKRVESEAEKSQKSKIEVLQRGDILLNTEIRGDSQSSRVESFSSILSL